MTKYRRGALVLMVAGVASIGSATADEVFRPVTDPVVQKECKACHMLYPVGLLPARSWKKMIDGLQNHFGENASVDEATAKVMSDYLVANAAQERGARRGTVVNTAGEPPLRITELDWFKRKHDAKGRTSPAALARKNIKSASECLACHKAGESGDFGD